MIKDQLITNTVNFVKKQFLGAEGGHDWSHTERVWTNAKKIGLQENVDMLVVELAALLHDIADAKFHAGDESIGPSRARKFLNNQGVDLEIIEHVINIMMYMSFRSNIEGTHFSSLEMQVVQDADRLDAIGAIGIARAFSYGGHKGHKIFDPSIPVEPSLTKASYKSSNAPMINHFYDKLLKLKDLMNTETGRQVAEQRHQFMLDFLSQFYDEVGTNFK